ncbi:MAG: hypothetical protein LRY55_02465 [Leadbetterella sp.]|nr:hypothetical protein [Leadbetterella sp.]
MFTKSDEATVCEFSRVLVVAALALDKAVDKCYRPQPFTSDAKRVEYLFELYEEYTNGLLAAEKPKRGRKK